MSSGDSIAPIQVVSGDEYYVDNGDGIAVDFTNILNGSTITSVDSVSIVRNTTEDALVITNAAVNSSTYVDDDGATVGVGKAVQFDLTGGKKYSKYMVEITVTLALGGGTSKRVGEVEIEVQ